MKKIVCCLVSFAAALCAIADDFSLVNKGSSSAPVAWSDISNWTNRTLGAMADRIPGENDHLKANAYVALDGDYTIDTYLDYYAQLHVFRTEGIENTVSLTVKSRLGSGGYQRYIVYNGAKIVLSDTATLNGANGDAGPSIAYINDGGTIDVFGTVDSRHMEWDIKDGGVLNYAPKSYSTGRWEVGHKDKFHVAGTLNFPYGLNVQGQDKAVAQINHNSGTVTFGGDFSSVCSWHYTWKAGTLAVTEDVLFPANVEVAVAANADVTVDVFTSKTFVIKNLNFSDGASLLKTGDGTLVMDALPDVLTLQGGGVRTSSAVPAVVFAGGELELVAETKSISCISAVSAEEGAKAKISLRDLYLLLPGEYTIVAAGNTLTDADYEFDIDDSVSATVAVKDDGSVALSVTGVSEDANPLVWDPQNEGDIWDAATAAWADAQGKVSFADGRTVLFNGAEANYTGKIVVKSTPKPLQVVVSGDKDYSFSGDAVDTLYVSKSGTGTLKIDGAGFTGRNFEISGGVLSFSLSDYFDAQEASKISASGNVRLSSHSVGGFKLFDFRYKSGSANWDTTDEYTSKLMSDTIAEFISKASPNAPDGTSLSGKSVYVAGMFYVSAQEAGEWEFKGIYDDGIILSVEGTQLFKTTSHTDTRTGKITLSEGWHKFKVRAYDGTGGWGHADCLMAKAPSSADYAAFHEGNFNMNWYGSQVDPNLPPSRIPLDLTVADGASLVFGSAGYVIENLVLGENISISIDPNKVPANMTFLTVNETDAKAILKELIQESLGTIGTVVETDDGLAWEMEAVFNNSEVSDLENPAGWQNGIVPGSNEDITIVGEGVNPVMNEETRAFNSITVADGASFTVAATREIPVVTLNAGTTFSVREDSARVTAAGAFSTLGDGIVMVNVEEGCVLDLSSIDVSCQAKIIKRGTGAIIFGRNNLPSEMSVEAGLLVMQPGVPYDLSGVEIAESAQIAVWQDGAVRVAYPVAGEGGTEIYYARGTYFGIGGWNDLSNWVGGVLPQKDDVVRFLTGSQLTIDEMPSPMPASFEVGDGAALTIAVDCALPKITLEKSAVIEIASGAEFSLENEALKCVPLVMDDEVVLPVLRINEGATLSVAPGMKFKNVDIRHFGKITGNDVGALYFGYAESGETTYFAMAATNATIKTIGSKNSTYSVGQQYFVRPASGGRVSVVRPLELKSVSFEIGDLDGIEVGVNNPIDESFTAYFDDLAIVYARSAFGGASEVYFRNCRLARPAWKASGHQGRWDIKDKAKLIYENTQHYYEYPDGNSVNWSPSDDNAECLVLTNSTVMWTRPTGNKRGVMTVYDSFYDCQYDAYSPGHPYSLPNLLRGLKALNIPEGAYCGIRAKDHVTWGTNASASERLAKIDSEVSIAGAGDLVISNAVQNRYFEVIMQSSVNTCTGRLTTYSPQGFDAKLLFADGANWAGTVVSGNVALTNLSEEAEIPAASVNFAKLDLAADFPVRVWRDENGALVSDTLNVGEYLDSGANGGRLALVAMFEGEFAPGETFVLGTISKNAELPRVGRGWTARRVEGETVDTVEVERNSGFTITIR